MTDVIDAKTSVTYFLNIVDAQSIVLKQTCLNIFFHRAALMSIHFWNLQKYIGQTLNVFLHFHRWSLFHVIIP